MKKHKLSIAVVALVSNTALSLLIQLLYAISTILKDFKRTFDTSEDCNSKSKILRLNLFFGKLEILNYEIFHYYEY
jgi:hypothetical protein